MYKTSFKLLILVLLGFCLPSALEPHSYSSDVSINVDPDKIKIGAFYHGTSVSVTANTPLCEGVVVKIESDGREVVLNKKGKVGVIWLNVAKITVGGAPEVYILASSDDVANICSTDAREQLLLGTDALDKKISFESEKPLTGKEFGEFLKLKQHAGTYNYDIPIVIEPASDKRQTITASLPLPSVMPSGNYTVRLYCFEGGDLIEDASAPLTIEKVGLPRLESELAHEHPAAYGITAILVAMVAGITMGVMFSSRGGGH
jgi:uncharacterized protein (TIGR02186 family)